MTKRSVLVLWIASSWITGCDAAGGDRTLSARIDRLGQAVNATYSACSSGAPAATQDERARDPAAREPVAREPAEPADPGSPFAFAPVLRTARVARVTGEMPIDGDRCYVSVWPVEVHDDDAPQNCRVRVECGSTQLFGPDVGPDDGGDWGWALCGIRDGRVDTAADFFGAAAEEDAMLRMRLSTNELAVWDEGYRVELRLDPAPAVAGGFAPRIDDPLSFTPSVRFGTVRAVSGTDAVATGASCVVQVWPNASDDPTVPLNGRVRVRCGETDLYGPDVGSSEGNWGFVFVGTRGGEPALAVDATPSVSDDDPQLELDLVAGRVIVAEAGASRVEIGLEP